MQTSQDPLVPYRLRTVRLGVQATWLVLLALVALALLPHVPFEQAPYWAILATAAIGVGVIGFLPWKRLFDAGWGIRLMYLWSGFDIVLITAILGVVGPESPEVFAIYALTTLFFAASYPPRGQVALLVFTWACYLGLLALTGWEVPVGSIVARIGILGAMTFLASFLSRELMRQIAAHSEALEVAENRSRLLGIVAGAARGIAELDSDRVLAAVVGSASALGFDATELCIFDPATNTYRVSHGHDIPEGYRDAVHPAEYGLVGMVLERQETVIVDDYSRHPRALPSFRGYGFRATIGTPVWSQGQLAGVLNGGSKVPRDITAQERESFELLAALAGRALENARRFEDEQATVARLAELDRLKQEFLSMVSHELRTPLTVIEGMGLTLEDRWEEMDETVRREFIQQMNRNSETLHGIITSLLDFSQLDAGKLQIHEKHIDLGKVVTDVASRLTPLGRDHVLMTEADGGLMVSADPLLLDRVVENLISNALKHTPAGTGILVSARRADDYALVSVADEGPGIAEADLPRMGERFFRGGDPNSRTTKGIGLGLALAREILEHHGATLTAESEPGQGTSFSFRLPLVTQPSSEELSSRPSGSRSSR